MIVLSLIILGSAIAVTIISVLKVAALEDEIQENMYHEFVNKKNKKL